jgi:hypothetical protein
MNKTIPIVAAPVAAPSTAIEGDGMGCHAGGEKMLAAAKASGKSEVLAQYAKDYPANPNAGPHDQPQSMCPAFGALRVGLRLRRTAPEGKHHQSRNHHGMCGMPLLHPQVKPHRHHLSRPTLRFVYKLYKNTMR